MPFLLHPNLKADMWSKHKSFLAGSTGVGDKLKTLETFAKCKEDDAAGLQNLIGAIAALMQVAVPAFQKTKASKIVPASTSAYLQEMIAKATELRALVAKKQEELKSKGGGSAGGVSEEWIKNAIERIKSNRNSVSLINQEINSKHITGKETDNFKNWASNSQTSLKGIFESLNSKKVEKSEVQKIDSTINQYMKDANRYETLIHDIIQQQGELKTVQEDWGKQSLEKIKSYRNSVTLLNQEITSKHLSGKDVDEFIKWVNSSQTYLKKINDDLLAKKIDATQTQKIDSTLNSYLNDLKKYQAEIKQEAIDQIKGQNSQQEWGKQSLAKIKSYRNSIQLINTEISSKKLSGKEVEEFKKWANISQASLKKIDDDLISNKIDATQTKKIEAAINGYLNDAKEFQKEISSIKNTK